MQDPEDIVRGYAALALGWVGTPQMVPELRNHLAAERARGVREDLAAATYRWMMTPSRSSGKPSPKPV
jgi:HEAT repeat protein